MHLANLRWNSKASGKQAGGDLRQVWKIRWGSRLRGEGEGLFLGIKVVPLAMS